MQMQRLKKRFELQKAEEAEQFRETHCGKNFSDCLYAVQGLCKVVHEQKHMQKRTMQNGFQKLLYSAGPAGDKKKLIG